MSNFALYAILGAPFVCTALAFVAAWASEWRATRNLKNPEVLAVLESEDQRSELVVMVDGRIFELPIMSTPTGFRMVDWWGVSHTSADRLAWERHRERLTAEAASKSLLAKLEKATYVG